MEILKNEIIEDHEGRDGRIRSRNRTEWFVVAGGELLRSFDTLKEAKAYVKEREGQ